MPPRRSVSRPKHRLFVAGKCVIGIGFHNSVIHSFSGSHFRAGTCFSSLQVDLTAEIWWTDEEIYGAIYRLLYSFLR